MRCARLSRLCAVVRRPSWPPRMRSRTTDGRLPGGADGFNGWTSGLKRSRDPKALKRMYKADTLKQLEALDEAELEVPGGLEIEEIAPCDDLNGADDGGDGSDDDDSDDGGVSLALAIASKKVDRKKQQRAWRAENKAVPHNNVAKHNEKEDGAEGGALSTRARCALFPSRVDVHAHPELGVALCFYCNDAAEAFAAGGAVTAEQSCLRCGGASERNDDDAEAAGELLGCDDCHRWVRGVRAATSATTSSVACVPPSRGPAMPVIPLPSTLRKAAALRCCGAARAPRRALAAWQRPTPTPRPRLPRPPRARPCLVFSGGGAPPGTFSNVTPPSRDVRSDTIVLEPGAPRASKGRDRPAEMRRGGVARGAAQGAPA